MSTFKDVAMPWVAGLGVYEPGRPIEEVARELGLDVEGVIKLASNENALGPSPKAVRAMKKAATEMHRYPDGGAFYLVEALAKKLGMKPNEVLLGSGSNEIIEFVGHVFLGPGTSIVMADRAFVVYKLVASMFRAETVSVPMQAFTHDLPAMVKAVRPDTKLVFVSNPNNPTGTMVNGRAIDRFLETVPDHVVVVFDEAYIELLPPKKQPDVLRYVREGRKVIVLRTFSKTYGLAGLRIGYALAPPECMALLHRVRQPFNTTAMAQAAALAALEDEGYVRRTRRLVGSGLAYFGKELTARGIEFVPSVANFLLVKVGQGREVFEALQKLGVIVRPMGAYGLSEYVRLTLGTPAENERCMQALSQVLKK